MKEKSPNTVIKSAKDALSTTVLLRGVRASETKNRAMCGEKITNSEVVKLLPVVCLQRKNGPAKLRADIRVEADKSGDNVRLAAQREGPHIMREIIKYDKIIKKACVTGNRRCPNITMNNIKGKSSN